MRHLSYGVLFLFLAAMLAAPAGADISGTVFRDVDGDGVNDGGIEAGVGGISVQAFNAASNTPVDTTTTASDGTYTLTLIAATYRVEFIIPTALDYLQPSASLSGSGNTSVVFAVDGATVDFGVINPGQFCQADPILAVNCYLRGSQPLFVNAGEDVLISFPYAAGCVDEDFDGVCDAGSVDTPTPTELAIGSEIGTTWGTAYQRSTDTLFVAAFQKRHSGFRAFGDTGLIFRVDDASTGAAATVSDYVDFDALGFATADTVTFPPNGDPHPTSTETCSSSVGPDPGSNTNANCWVHDADSYGQVGRMAFGDMDISDDESTLWTINLFDNSLYSIPVQTAAVVAGDIASFALPTPACNGALEPFAVAFEDGLVYVGMVCDGPAIADLQAYVHSFDPDTSTFTERLNEPLDYVRGLVVASGGGDIQAEWQPWSDDFADVFGPVFGTERALPQPWLTDIEFDNGEMILGFRDRFADQSGFDDGAPSCVVGAGPPDFDCTASGITVRGDAAGDMLRACPSGAVWVFESNAENCSAVATAGAGNGQGPGGGEYYFEDELTGFHDEITLGGLYQVPINSEAVISVYDPLNSAAGADVFSGGINWYRRSDGERDNQYRVFLRTNPDTFGKAGGIGDVEALCDPAPLEIGNRVWSDTDNDGLQDPGESGINGITVELLEDTDGDCSTTGDQTSVGTDVTAGDGEYLFTDANVTGGLQYGMNYCLRIDTTQGGLSGTGPAPLDAAPVGDGNDDIRDSDGDSTLVTGFVVTGFTTGGPGSNRHIYDFGFRALEFDWGDLPDVYGTLSASSGANHETTSVGNVFLGGAPDNELDGQPSADGLDDDNDLNGDDEDGVLFLHPLVPGFSADIQVTGSATSGTGADGVGILNAWIDFNSDGDFADPGEQIATNFDVEAGAGVANVINIASVPAGATGVMAARFRITTAAGQGGGSPTGAATTGEVEDYVLGCIGDFFWNDNDGNGIQDALEGGVNGGTIELVAPIAPFLPIVDALGVPITTTSTTSAPLGGYEFCGLPTVENSGRTNPGEYRLFFNLPATASNFSPPDAGGDDTVDSDADDTLAPGLAPVATSSQITINSGVTDDTVDAGVVSVTAALITSAAAYVDSGSVVFEFSTGYEALSAGFEVYRYDRAFGDYLPVTERAVPALVGAPQGGVYRVVDADASLDQKLRYVVFEHQADGRIRAYGPFVVTVEKRGERAPLEESFAARPHVTARFAGRMARSQKAAPRAKQARTDGPRSVFKGKASRRIGLRRHRRRGPQSPSLQLDVREAGLYYVSSAEIAAVAGLPEGRVRRMVTRGEIALENQGQSVSWMSATRSGGGLYFYGEAIDSLYTLDNTYWLRLSTTGTAIARVEEPYPLAAPGGVFSSVERFEQDLIAAITTTLETEVDYWYWDGINAASANTVRTFDVAVPDSTAGSATITARFTGATNGPASRDHHAIVRLNGVEVATAAWGGMSRYEAVMSFDGSLLTPTTTIEIEGFLDEGSTASVFFIDGFDVEYTRSYRALDDRVLVTGDGNPVITVEGYTTADIVVFDLTDPAAPRLAHNVRVEMGASGFQASFVPSTASTPYLVTTSSSALAGANLRVVAPVIDLKATHHRYEHVVIAPEAWRTEAQALATYRSGEGTSSLAISLEDVYNAFSDGIVTPWAIRDFLAYARDNWSRGPQYAVLAGRGTFDPRNLLGGGDNFLPAVLVGTSFGLISSDNVLADLSGSDSIPEVAIGRLPIVSAAELATYVDKLEAYDTSTGAWRDRALLLADNADAAGDFPAQSDAVAALLVSYSQELVYLSEMTTSEARAALQTAWNNGVQLVNYIGHGGVAQAAAEGLLRTSDMGLLSNGDRLPIVSALTCAVGRSDIPNFESLAEALVTDADGGAIAVWAPTGLSLSGAAFELNTLYVAILESAEANTALGDIVLDTLDAFGTGGGSVEMLNAYGITGDPAVGFP